MGWESVWKMVWENWMHCELGLKGNVVEIEAKSIGKRCEIDGKSMWSPSVSSYKSGV
jgi:hypothetical protein